MNPTQSLQLPVCTHAQAPQQQPAPFDAQSPLISKLITFTVTSVASALIAWGALQQQVSQLDRSANDAKAELKEIRKELQQFAIAQARTATALEIIVRKDRRK